MQDQFNKGGSVLSEDKRNQLARDIDEKKKRLERDMQDAQEEFYELFHDLMDLLGLAWRDPFIRRTQALCRRLLGFADLAQPGGRPTPRGRCD